MGDVLDELSLAPGQEILAWDSLGSIATIGVFGPALVLVGLVVGAVVRDRRLSARERAEAAREDGGAPDRPTPPPAD
jgi:hypothetical protein